MRNRTQARQIALQFLYMLDVRSGEILNEYEAFLGGSTDKEEVRDFCENLILGTNENRAAIDGRISQVAHNWRLERMAVIDRNILRMATYELLFRDDIPPIVTINEAIELAKHFSTEKSSSFVNGILDRINNDILAETGGAETGGAATGEAETGD